MQNQCPKCGKSIKKDANLLSLIFLFGEVNLKNKKAVCDLCGSKLRKRK
jgi:rRNA maturation endonuclease Nob1